MIIPSIYVNINLILSKINNISVKSLFRVLRYIPYTRSESIRTELVAANSKVLGRALVQNWSK